jgi:hypothetical protein
MIKVVCDNCKIEIVIPDNYNAPFIQCPDCGSIQKLKNEEIPNKEPKYKILDEKGRQRAANHYVSEEYKEEILKKAPKVVLPKPEPKPLFKIDSNLKNSVVDQKKLLLDSMGEDGLNKAYIYASKYIFFPSEKYRKNSKTKAIRLLMREKYPVELATKAIEFAERAPETLELAKKNKLIIIIAAISVIIIILLALILL